MTTRAVGVRSGVTLIELLVVIAILGISAGVAAIAIGVRGRATEADPGALLVARLADARREALRTGRVVTIAHTNSVSVGYASALPDGSIVADSLIARVSALDRLSGRVSVPGTNAASQR